jgi:hypothetical protein
LERALQVVFGQRETLDKEATGEVAPLSPDQLQQLIALGYVGEDEEAASAPPPEGSPLATWRASARIARNGLHARLASEWRPASAR